MKIHSHTQKKIHIQTQIHTNPHANAQTHTNTYIQTANLFQQSGTLVQDTEKTSQQGTSDPYPDRSKFPRWPPRIQDSDSLRHYFSLVVVCLTLISTQGDTGGRRHRTKTKWVTWEGDSEVSKWDGINKRTTNDQKLVIKCIKKWKEDGQISRWMERQKIKGVKTEMGRWVEGWIKIEEWVDGQINRRMNDE